MTRRPLARRAAALAAAALALTALPFVPPAAAAAASRTAAADTIRMAVISVSPSTPEATYKLRRLSVRLSLVNSSGKDLHDVRIVAERGDPIGTQAALDKALANPAPPTTPAVEIRASHPKTIDLPGNGSLITTFTTTASISTDAGLCICATATQPLIYPLFFSAHVTGPGGVDQSLGTAATYVPSFSSKPAPVHVSWIWPLIDRPHRLTGDTVFADDELTGLVSPLGRLSRALEVVENVGGKVPITLVIDPELLDELFVMATGKYTVRAGGRTVPGLGQGAASAWLARLQAVLAAHPQIQVELTPYADPDVESLHHAGLGWSRSMPPAMRTHVTAALGATAPDSTIAWPAAGAISQATLQILAKDGVGTVVLDRKAVTSRGDASTVPAGLARVSASGIDIAAALTDSTIEKYAAAAIALGGPAARPLPQLIAELAVRAAQEPTTEHVAVITAPRYVDPDVDAATRAIEETSTSTFAQPISLQSAVAGTLLPVGRSRLATVPASAAALPDSSIDAARLVTTSLPALRSLLNPRTDRAAATVLAELPIALQRAESSAWRVQRTAGGQFADQLSASIHAVMSGVRIVRPSSGSYTLASDNSPLPITVHNGSPYVMRVRVEVGTVGNVPGFATEDVGVQTVESGQNRTLNLPTSIQRSGRFQVQAQLLTPNGAPLGDPVPLTVHSTALGEVGVVITIVAGVVLALALLARVLGRLRKRRAVPAGAPT